MKLSEEIKNFDGVIPIHWQWEVEALENKDNTIQELRSENSALKKLLRRTIIIHKGRLEKLLKPPNV